MAEHMGNDKVVRHLIGFLPATEIGGRQGVNRISREWETRVDMEGEQGLDGQVEHEWCE